MAVLTHTLVYERPAAVMALTLVEPGKPFLACRLKNLSGPKDPQIKVKVTASAYGATEAEALEALAAARVPYKAPLAVVAKAKARTISRRRRPTAG